MDNGGCRPRRQSESSLPHPVPGGKLCIMHYVLCIILIPVVIENETLRYQTH